MRLNTRMLRFLIVCAVVAAASLGERARAVPREDGPMYLTDTHGASGVAHALLELSLVDARYTPYWKGALDWLISVADKDEAGRMTWRFSTSAPKNHPNRRINAAGVCHIANMFRRGYERSGDVRYKDTFIAAVRWLTEKAMLTKQTKYGLACGWSHNYKPGDKGSGLLAGHSHGLGNFIETILNAYKLEKDERLKEVLLGMLMNLRLRGREMGKDTFAWPRLRNNKIVETGYCYGQAGIIIPLLDLAETLPDLKLSDGTSARSLANANLRYLMSVARKAKAGYVWPYMRHEEKSLNIGYGSGAGGIGWAFLRGAQVNREINPAFAEECMKYARGAAEFAVHVIMKYPETERFRSPGGSGGFGVCGGASGGCHFLKLFAQEIGESDRDFAGRINTAMERVGKVLINTAEEIDGTLVWKKDARTVNMALDYGQTGAVLALTSIGVYLKNDGFLAAARRGADFIVRQAVPAGGGYKFPLFVNLPE